MNETFAEWLAKPVSPRKLGPGESYEKMRMVQVMLPPRIVDKLDAMAEDGVIPNRSEGIRHMIYAWLLFQYNREVTCDE